MKLKKVLRDIETIRVKGSKEIDITGVFSHSKVVFPGCMFIAKRGINSSGNQYIQNAISNGAKVVVLDMYNPFLSNITQVVVEDPAAVEAKLAANFYNTPSMDLITVGITGTCGKTTTSYYTKHLLEKESSTGLIGTIETDMHLKKFKSSYTTPTACQLMRMHREMHTYGCKNCVMEVSSHGLDQYRLQETYFDVTAFLNISHEHLDYHKTMEIYKEAKLKLLRHRKEDGIVVASVDNAFGREVKRLHPEAITFGFSSKADVYAKKIAFDEQGSIFDLYIGLEKRRVRIPLIGEFNVENALAAIAISYSLGITVNEIEERLKSLPVVPGRMEKIKATSGPTILIDYAHKVDGLEKVLKIARKVYKKKLIVVFGCGGDRDKEKRPLMGKLAEKYCDYIILTNDNPRSEEPRAIIKEIESGMSYTNHDIVEDRKEAIEKAVRMAQSSDAIVIAGKGHEESQEILGRKYDLSDRKLAKDIVSIL